MTTDPWLRAFLDPQAAIARGVVRRPQSALALLLDGRLLEYEQLADRAGYPRLGGPPIEVGHLSPGVRLLATLVGQLSGQGGSAEAFGALVTDERISAGGRTVAALLSSIAASDDGNSDGAIETLRRRLITARQPLEVALLSLHLGYRQLEAGMLEAATESVGRAIGKASPRSTDLYSNAVYIQAKHLEAYLISFRDQRIPPQVPSQSDSPLLTRIEVLEARGLSQYMTAHFDQEFEAIDTRTFVLRPEDPVERSLAGALLRAECFADWSRTARVRSLLGKYRLISAVGEQDRAPEPSFLLLIRAGDDKATRLAVRAFRRLGPLQPLRNVGSIVAVRPWLPRETKASLVLLAETATVLSERPATDVAIRLLGSLQGLTSRTVFGAWISDVAFGAIGSLLSVASDDIHPEASAILRSYVSEARGPALQDASRAVRGLDWSRIGSSEQDRWREFVGAYLGQPDDRSVVASAAAYGLASNSDAGTTALIAEKCSTDPTGRLTAMALNLGIELDASTVARTSTVLVEHMNLILERAAAGSYGIGGTSPAVLLAGLSIRYGHLNHWEALARFLVERDAPGDERVEVLNFLAAHADEIPHEARALLGAAYEPPGRFAIFLRQEEFVGASLRLRSALRSIMADEALRTMLVLATGSRASRMEAARSIPFLTWLIDDRVLATFALQLANERAPEVRAATASALVALVAAEKLEQRNLIEEQLMHCVADPGDIVPLATIHAISASPNRVPRQIVAQAKRIARAHLDSRVRIAGNSLPT